MDEFSIQIPCFCFFYSSVQCLLNRLGGGGPIPLFASLVFIHFSPSAGYDEVWPAQHGTAEVPPLIRS